jgi:hypothetical protein
MEWRYPAVNKWIKSVVVTTPFLGVAGLATWGAHTIQAQWIQGTKATPQFESTVSLSLMTGNPYVYLVLGLIWGALLCCAMIFISRSDPTVKIPVIVDPWSVSLFLVGILVFLTRDMFLFVFASAIFPGAAFYGSLVTTKKAG